MFILAVHAHLSTCLEMFILLVQARFSMLETAVRCLKQRALLRCCIEEFQKAGSTQRFAGLWHDVVSCSKPGNRRLSTATGSTKPPGSYGTSSSGAAAGSTAAQAATATKPSGNGTRIAGLAGSLALGAAVVYWARSSGGALETASVPASAEQIPGPGVQPVEGEDHALVNWSGTHEVRPQRFYQPESVEELERLVQEAHEKGQTLRCVGSALSPNGLAFCEAGMVSLALLDEVVSVDPAAGRVTVQAGARIEALTEALRPHGLALQNYASIREQAIGGFIQVGAHGTGAKIPPVDEQVVGLKLVTPGRGTLELSAEREPELFRLARCGLGCLGVVAEVTLQCVPAHKLKEHTFTTTVKEVKRRHKQWLAQHQHLRYMWIPHTDSVVVVTNDPIPADEPESPPAVPKSKYNFWGWWRKPKPELPEAERRAPLLNLLLRAVEPERAADPALRKMSATALRDQLLAMAPLDTEWVKRVNQAEAEYWRLSEGYRVGWSDQLLGFDCGGQQWVLELAFPTGTLQKPDGSDLKFMEELLAKIKAGAIPAHSPIEQRWSATSPSPLSPASAPGRPDTLHSWVGIIMYLPTEDPREREQITESFREYASLVERDLLPKFGATEHWAKLEVLHRSPEQRAALAARMAARFPAEQLAAARAQLDPNNILSNEFIDIVFPRPATS